LNFSIDFASSKSLHHRCQSQITPKKGFQMRNTRNTLLIVIAFGFANARLLYAQQPTPPVAPMPPAAPAAATALPPTPKVQFSVSVIAEAAKTFRKTLKSSQKYNDSKCEERAADHLYHKMDVNWPRKLENNDDNLYLRFFYLCSKPDPETYAIFGSASLAAAKIKAVSGNDDKDDFEAVRVVADIDWGGGGGAACQIWTCPNGTPKKALNPTCTPAC
jgi:hypothetical protein